jgi:hypothetical protein
VDVSSITLHFEPTREPIPSDCFLAAIQLENSFENPLYVKCSPSVSAIKSKDSVQFDTESERVKNSWITNQRLIGKCRAGDYVIHSWNLFGRNDGYCGATVCFLRDNGYEEEVDGIAETATTTTDGAYRLYGHKLPS